MSDVPPSKPWSIAQFEKSRSHMAEWVVNTLCPRMDYGEWRRVVIRAPVKSGKREIVEYMAKRDDSATSTRVHCFLSAFHRVADEDQRKEIALHNVRVFSITKKSVANECVQWIKAQIELNKTVVIHLDECDYGSGIRQNMSNVYASVRDLPQVFLCLYSATPQEVLFSADSGQSDEDNPVGVMLDDMLYGAHVEYTPPEGFCGPGRFLDENLVTEAMPFFITSGGPILTDQGREIIAGLKDSAASGSGRNVLALRLSKKDGRAKRDKDIYKFLEAVRENNLPELNGVIVMVDKDDGYAEIEGSIRIGWSSRNFWDVLTKVIPIIVVYDQTASRSTEWSCHHRVYASHDYRTTIDYATYSQAIERANHYAAKYGGFQPIRIYGHKSTLELSAGRISYEQWFASAREWVKRKVDVRRAARNNLVDPAYEIKDRAGNLHPLYTTPMSLTDVDKALLQLGCGADLAISSRVKGSVRRLPVVGIFWFPTTEETFTRDIEHVKTLPNHEPFRAHPFANPYQHARRPPPGADGMQQGYLRRWGVFDYDRDVNSSAGWGIEHGRPRLTVCYKDGVLGVAVRWHTGEFRMEDRLTAYRSMYPSRRA
jgi:hypothetical protein